MNVKEMLDKESKRIAESRKEFEQFRTVAEKLPASTQFKSVTKHAYRGSLRIQLEDAANVEAVRDLLIQFPPVKLIRYKDSCLSFLPVESLREKEVKRIEDGDAEETQIAPVTVSLDQVAHYPTKFEVRWFSRINGVLCQVETEVKTHPARIVPTFEEDYRGRKIKTGYELQGIPSAWCAQISKYASGSTENANPFVLWWHWDSDNEQTRPEGFLPSPWKL
jgi:hypothetical protein